MTDTDAAGGNSPQEPSFEEILSRSALHVSGDRIDLVTDGIVVPIASLTAFEAAWNPFRDTHPPPDDLAASGEPDPVTLLLEAGNNFFAKVEYGVRQSLAGSHSGKLHKSLHKGLHKSLHKSLHKGLHKGLSMGAPSYGGGFSWPVIEVPWREISRLYNLRDTAPSGSVPWDRHWIPECEKAPATVYAPPTVDQLSVEIEELHRMQHSLRQPGNAYRRERIVVEATNDLTAYMLPLGADAGTPTGNTAVMFQVILWLGSMIGQQYKARYNLPRPNVLDPTLEPYIPVPSYSSWPSNHAFQSFLIAEVFSRMVPEHGGATALFKAAWEVAVNREFAGLHYRSDTLAGMELSRLIAPDIEIVLEDHRRGVRAEWLGESEEGGE